MNILHITSSVRGNDSESTRVTNQIVEKLLAANPGATVTRRDFGANPHPLLDGAAVGALFTPVDKRTVEQAARVALDDALIAEAQAADVIVLGAPMYNFSMPVQLKGWFDAIARAGVTFRYTETGPEGLLKNKKVYVATSRGGVYPAEADPQVPQMRALLNFLGLTDHTFIYSSGMAMGPEAVSKGQAAANEAIVAALA
ncbi:MULTISPECIES: FMN-dependent NADH-azoreductase [unclassified Massilia]|uniref:FMN-dependent NADH-azoreductase n=1 Tax=unclassified Massilia TaxID=2609279 RepID=UPI001B83FE5C|nr:MULTISPECIES: NAD(P)H-dependent oxidoreductase [unclassified Massilia]MBQ5939843.1 NAD(P)H-dependent oxidoreductase [Massilia sp. AB1]MBQ5963123.1 NAD(P)H-dependent oxidoreductase [Massilia sp. ZL223]